MINKKFLGCFSLYFSSFFFFTSHVINQNYFIPLCFCSAWCSGTLLMRLTILTLYFFSPFLVWGYYYYYYCRPCSFSVVFISFFLIHFLLPFLPYFPPFFNVFFSSLYLYLSLPFLCTLLSLTYPLIFSALTVFSSLSPLSVIWSRTYRADHLWMY